MTRDEALNEIREWHKVIQGEWGRDPTLDEDLKSILAALGEPTEPWLPPPAAERPDGFECLIWHDGRWRHVSWSVRFDGWSFGYASAFTMDTGSRFYAPLSGNTPEHNFWEGRPS